MSIINPIGTANPYPQPPTYSVNFQNVIMSSLTPPQDRSYVGSIPWLIRILQGDPSDAALAQNVTYGVASTLLLFIPSTSSLGQTLITLQNLCQQNPSSNNIISQLNSISENLSTSPVTTFSLTQHEINSTTMNIFANAMNILNAILPTGNQLNVLSQLQGTMTIMPSVVFSITKSENDPVYQGIGEFRIDTEFFPVDDQRANEWQDMLNNSNYNVDFLFDQLQEWPPTPS